MSCHADVNLPLAFLGRHRWMCDHSWYLWFELHLQQHSGVVLLHMPNWVQCYRSWRSKLWRSSVVSMLFSISWFCLGLVVATQSFLLCLFVDIDECLEDVCGPGKCINEPGSFMCDCRKGFEEKYTAAPVCQGLSLHLFKDYIHTYIHTYVHIRTYIHIYIHIHAYI